MKTSLAPQSYDNAVSVSTEAPWREARVTAGATNWGWLPALTLNSSLGLLLVAFATTLARSGNPWAEPLLWVGLGLLFLPIAARILLVEAERHERIGLLLVLGIALYLVKVLHSPAHFTFADEFMHWRTAEDMLSSGSLFVYNPLLPISSLYPGLETVVTALTSLSGLSIYTSGLIVLAVARLVFTLALFLFFEQATQSARVAGIATMLYMTNPNYVFFGSQFAYETLSLPMAALVLFFALRREQHSETNGHGYSVFLLMALGAVLITHHLTTYALVAFLLAWTLVDWCLRRRSPHASAIGPGNITLLACVAALAWLMWIADRTVSYLVPPFSKTAIEMLRLLAGESGGRQLFRSATGVAPLPERLTGIGSVLLLLAMLPSGLWEVWRRQRNNVMLLVCAVGALAYPATLALRFSQRGAEISNRASEFVFIPLVLVIALAVVASDNWRWMQRLRTTALPMCATIIFLGGVIVGWAPWSRLPGPYAVAADARSIEPQGTLAAFWMRDYLGSNKRIASDRTNRLLFGSYGQQRPVTSYGDQLPVAQVFFAPTLGPTERMILQRGQVEYLVVDRRLSDGLPLASSYFEGGENAGKRPETPLAAANLAKFDELAGVSRIFDSGDIRIYDLKGLRDEPHVP